MNSEQRTSDACIHEYRPIDSSGQLACVYCNARAQYELRTADASVMPAREIDGELWIRAADAQALTRQHAEIMAALQQDRDYWQEAAQRQAGYWPCEECGS